VNRSPTHLWQRVVVPYACYVYDLSPVQLRVTVKLLKL
jgi:hypothetical protein